jgi:hypothetical protein
MQRQRRKNYSAINSIARFWNKIIVLYFKNALAYYNVGVVAVNLKVVGLAPGFGQLPKVLKPTTRTLVVVHSRIACYQKSDRNH